MRRKIGLTIDSSLYKRVKLYCAERDIAISELFSYAVEMYINRLEMIEQEMKNREISNIIEDNYNEIVKQDLVEIREIGSRE